jgi:ribosomal protein S18 acetylase RimI-like enzyme
VIVRAATAADREFLRAMIYDAACWRDIPHAPFEDVLAEPAVARYVEDWGRAGDLGVIAEIDGEPAGAAWLRLFATDDAGYGFVAEDVPELSIAVVAGKRGNGVGRALIDALVDMARAEGFRACSLSVEKDNPALRLYRRAGFAEVADDDGAWTMLLELRPS